MPVNLTFDIADLIGNDFDARRTKVWIETNIPGDAVVDTAGNKILLGDAKATVNADGTGSFVGLVATNATGLNLSGPFQYRAWVDYPRATGQQRSKWTSGWFDLTATTDLSDVVAEEAIPPTYVSQLTQQLDDHAASLEPALDAKVTEASGYATTAHGSATDAASSASAAAASASAAAAPTDTQVAGLVPTSSGSATAAALNASFATTGEVRSKAKADGTDQTSVVQAELDALYDSGGGTLVLRSSPLGAVPIKVSKLTLKNDAATPAKMPTICLRGQGMHWSGRGTAPQGGTILEFTGTDTYGLIKSNALGALVLTGLTLRNTTTANSTPFVYTTNTTLHIFRCAFYGAKIGTACDQDAIILGGPNQVEGGSGWTDGFQGYGTIIEQNFFSGVRTAVKGQAFANAVRVKGNTVWNTCGNPSGAAFEWDGKPTTGTQFAAGATIGENLIELTNYQYGVRLKNTVGFNVDINDLYDSSATTAAGVFVDATCQTTSIREGQTPAGLTPLVDNGAFTQFRALSQGVYSKQGPTDFGDANYDTTFKRLKVTGVNNFTVQPSAAQAAGQHMLEFKRSAAEATDVGASIIYWKYDGSVTVDPSAAGGGNWVGPFAKWTGGGRSWSGVGTATGQTNGANMSQDSGPGGSYFDMKNFGVRFYDHNGGPLRALIGGGADQIRLGPNGLTGIGIIHCTGTPEGTVTAPVGSIALRDNGAAGTCVYVKETGTGNTGWVSLGGLSRTVVTKTSNYTATLADHVIVSNGAPTITLPDPATVSAGRQWTVKNVNATAVTVASAGTSKTIDGAASQSLTQWAVANYISDGAQWLTV